MVTNSLGLTFRFPRAPPFPWGGPRHPVELRTRPDGHGPAVCEQIDPCDTSARSSSARAKQTSGHRHCRQSLHRLLATFRGQNQTDAARRWPVVGRRFGVRLLEAEAEAGPAGGGCVCPSQAGCRRIH